MKCCVIRDKKGEVVAAYPLVLDDGTKLEIKLNEGESTRVQDIPKKSMRTPEDFRKACEG